MIEINIKAELLRLLEDTAVLNKLKSLLFELDNNAGVEQLTLDIERLTVDVKRLTSERDSLQQANADYQQQIHGLDAEKQTLRSHVKNKEAESVRLKQVQHKNEQAMTSLSRQCDQYKANDQRLMRELQEIQAANALFTTHFSTTLTALASFRALSDPLKKGVSGIFSDTSACGFIACGVQERNIISLWDYIKHQIMKDVPVEGLIDLFYFLFDLYHKANPRFVLLSVKAGERFDPQQHIRSADSAASGDVEIALLQGWTNMKTQTVIKQTIVKVRE